MQDTIFGGAGKDLLAGKAGNGKSLRSEPERIYSIWRWDKQCIDGEARKLKQSRSRRGLLVPENICIFIVWQENCLVQTEYQAL